MRIKALLPLLLFLILAVALGIGLTLKPREIPSALLEKPVPAFSLPNLEGSADHFTDEDLRQGQVTVVNVFASWCAPCRVEHPYLTALAQDHDVALYGINYKDKPADAQRFLSKLGNPYLKIGADVNGRVGIDWGVYGVPETFVIDGHGGIVYKHIGPINTGDVEAKILPMIEKARHRTAKVQDQ
ncbi:MAG: DsbE family thiol:disulfide interchange protein [Kordiimonas sp.]|nr:DsbE family thiol:disulfide interchange protein [Kordiimonas sp.]|tara:strand:+ start:1020 stop:1574 length:555 start_codon:yes stop_codon:yes gene_type:complete